MTRVIKALLSRLAGHWRIDLAGVGYEGPPIDDEGFRVHPTQPSGRDTFGAYEAAKLVAERRPDVVLCHHDLWIMPRYLRVLRALCDRARLVAYVPLDGNIVDAKLAAPLLDFDQVILYTEWARRQVQRAWDTLGADRRPPLDVLPHGLDQDLFSPDAQLKKTGFASRTRAAARRRVFPQLEEPESAFVVLNPSRPAERKRLDLTLEGFARFSDGLPDNVKLCLHQAISDPEHEEELTAVVRRFDLERRLIRNPLGSRVASDDELVDLYRACDVGLNTSMGEGWGLVSFEHAATGGAQVVPGHSACEELWKGRAEIVPAARRLVPRFSPLELAEVDPVEVSRALARLYNKPDYLRRLCHAGCTMAHHEDLSWRAVSRRLHTLLLDQVFGADGIRRDRTCEGHLLSGAAGTD